MAQPDFAQATFSRANFAEMYERWLVGPLFRPWVADLLDRARLAAGDRVLDVACGTGIVARVAKERLGADAAVVGVDPSEQMLAMARSIAPNIEWRQGSAQALPVAGGEQFDVVTCQQGLQFFPDRAAAVREMRRVMAPAGRLAAATWRSLDEIPFILALHRVAERHLGPIADRRHACGDAGLLRDLLAGAGLRDVEVATIARTVRFDDASVFLRMNAMALVGMSPRSEGLGEEERGRLAATIAEESGPEIAAFANGPGVAFEMRTNVAVGRAD